MLARQAARTFLRQPSLVASSSRLFSSSVPRQTKVAVLGASGGIGQPLSLLLKLDPLVSNLSLYDIRGAPGVAADVSHIDSASEVCVLYAVQDGDSVLKLLRHRVQVKGFEADKLEAALEGAEVIVVPAGVPRKVRDLPI